MLQPHMTPAETRLFEKYLLGATKYIEFGCGGSTCFAASFSHIHELHSVESDQAWLEKLRTESTIAKAVAEKRLHLHHADIGPVGAWGVPTSTLYAHKWPSYYWGIWESLPFDADCILIDGRFRVACTLMALLYCTNENVHILIHDFTSRPEYHIVKKYLKEIEQVEDITAFAVNEHLDKTEVLLKLRHFIFEPESPQDLAWPEEYLQEKNSSFYSFLRKKFLLRRSQQKSS